MLTHSRLKGHLFILFWICVLRSVYAAPVPVSTFNSLSGSILFGEGLNFKVDFRNGGDALGYGPYVDLVVPVDTTNNRQALNINSATFLDTTISPTVFRGVASFLHPYAQDAAGNKQRFSNYFSADLDSIFNRTKNIRFSGRKRGVLHLSLAFLVLCCHPAHDQPPNLCIHGEKHLPLLSLNENSCWIYLWKPARR